MAKAQITFDISTREDLEEARHILNNVITWTEGDNATVASAPPPPPPPPPPTSTVPDAAPAETVAEVPLDSAGHRWTEKYHAGSKAKTKDGMWRRKKGVKKADVMEALADERLPPPASTPTPPTPPLAPPPPPPTETAPPPPPNGAVTWQDVATAFADRASKYTQDQLQTVLRSAMIEPTTLYGNDAQYPTAIKVLNEQCPL